MWTPFAQSVKYLVYINKKRFGFFFYPLLLFLIHFFFPNRNNCQIYKSRFYWCIFLRTSCPKDAFTSQNLTQKKSFARIPDGVSSLTVVPCVFPFVFCLRFLIQLLLMQEALLSLFFEMCLFLVFPQLQVFSFNFYLNTDFFCALSNQYTHF